MDVIISKAEEFTQEILEQIAGLIDTKNYVPNFIKRKIRALGFYSLLDKKDFSILLKILYVFSKACPALALLLLFHNISLSIIKTYTDINTSNAELSLALLEPASRKINEISTFAEFLGDRFHVVGIKSPVINVDADYFVTTACEKKNIYLVIVDSKILSDVRLHETFGLKGARIGSIRINGDVPNDFVKEISLNSLLEIYTKIRYGIISIICGTMETLNEACRDFLEKEVSLEIQNFKEKILAGENVNLDNLLEIIRKDTCKLINLAMQSPHVIEVGCTINRYMRDLLYLNLTLHAFSKSDENA